jgi:hypothetical protein
MIPLGSGVEMKKSPALKKAEDGADWFWLIRHQFIIPLY